MARKGEGRITKSFGIPISENAMYIEFEEVCSREGRSASEVITELIKEYTKIHKNGNPQHLLSSFQNNEDFIGFPSMATKLKDKRKYVQKVLTKNPKLKQEMKDHLTQWKGIIENE